MTATLHTLPTRAPWFWSADLHASRLDIFADRMAARDAEYRRLHSMPHGMRVAQIEARRAVVGRG